MSLTTYHEFEHAGKRYRFVYDEQYEVERPCGGGEKCDRKMHQEEAEEECDKWYQEEVTKLERGEWIALGVIVSARCPVELHCKTCKGWNEIASCWGIVIENSTAKAEEFAKGEL